MERRTQGSGSVHYNETRDRWEARLEAGYTRTGNRRRLTLIGKTRTEALAKLKAKQREIARDEAGFSANATIKKWSDEWLKMRMRKIRPDSYQVELAMVNKWIIPTIGTKKLAQISPKDIRLVHEAMEDAGRALSSITRAHGVMTKMLKDAAAEGYAIPQIVRDVPGPGVNEPDRKAIPIDHAIAILKAAGDREDASRWIAALLQGLRPAEALGLTWDAVDLEQNLIRLEWQLKDLPYAVKGDPTSGFRIPRGYETRHLTGAYHLVRPKTKAGMRVIPLIPAMKASLIAHRQITPPNPWNLVWPGYDKRYGQVIPQPDKADRRNWHAILKAAGVPEYQLYEARHTVASLLLAANVSPNVIIAIMGHSTFLSTQAYLHTDISQAREALELVGGRLGLEA
jgi:integrase